jgi:uncharacterized membrane protein
MHVNWQGRTISLRKAVLILLAVSFIFTTFSLLARHYNFKTAAYDTGIQAGVARNIALKGSFYNEVMDINHLADHFAPALALPGLLFYIWDDAAVLFIFQNICIFLSIIIAFYLAREILKDDFQALLVSFLYAVNYYLIAINTTDYHIDTLAVPLLLILLLLVERNQTKRSLLIVGLVSTGMLLIKEDFPLTVAGLGVFVLLFRPGKRTSGLIMFLIGSIGFYLILNYFMPKATGTEYAHINYYNGLGASTSEVVKNILTRPDIVFKNLVTPPEKLLRPVLLLLSFLFLPILAPLEICTAAVPIFYQMVSSYRHQYMFHAHYPAPAIPFLFYASVYGFKRGREILQKIKDRGWNRARQLILAVGAGLLIASTVIFVSSYARYLVRFDSQLYQTFESKVKPLIPRSSRVISSEYLQPHFVGYGRSCSLRNMDDVNSHPDYLVLYLRRKPLTMTEAAYMSFIAESRLHYEKLYEDSDFLVFRVADVK